MHMFNHILPHQLLLFFLCDPHVNLEICIQWHGWNDLPNVLESCSVTLYVDDTVLYFSSKLISEIETKMNSDLRQVCDWLKLNQLILNINVAYLGAEVLIK